MAENVVLCHIYFTTIPKNTQKMQTGEKGWAERTTKFSPRPCSSHRTLVSCLPGEARLIKSIHTMQALPGVVLFNLSNSLQGASSGLLPACVCPGTFLFQVTSCVALPGPGRGGGRQVRTTRATLPPLTGSPWASVTQREREGVPSGASPHPPRMPGGLCRLAPVSSRAALSRRHRLESLLPLPLAAPNHRQGRRPDLRLREGRVLGAGCSGALGLWVLSRGLSCCGSSAQRRGGAAACSGCREPPRSESAWGALVPASCPGRACAPHAR